MAQGNLRKFKKHVDDYMSTDKRKGQANKKQAQDRAKRREQKYDQVYEFGLPFSKQ